MNKIFVRSKLYDYLLRLYNTAPTTDTWESYGCTNIIVYYHPQSNIGFQLVIFSFFHLLSPKYFPKLIWFHGTYKLTWQNLLSLLIFHRHIIFVILWNFKRIDSQYIARHSKTSGLILWNLFQNNYNFIHVLPIFKSFLLCVIQYEKTTIFFFLNRIW